MLLTDLFAALHADTGDLQAAGWNLPPGAQLVIYSRHEDAFAPATRPRHHAEARYPPSHASRLSAPSRRVSPKQSPSLIACMTRFANGPIKEKDAPPFSPDLPMMESRAATTRTLTFFAKQWPARRDHAHHRLGDDGV